MPIHSADIGFVDKALTSEKFTQRFLGAAIVYGTVAANVAMNRADKVSQTATLGANRIVDTMLDSENKGVYALGITAVATSALVYGIGKEIKDLPNK